MFKEKPKMTKGDLVIAYLDLGSWAYLFGPSFAVAGVALVALVYLNKRIVRNGN